MKSFAFRSRVEQQRAYFALLHTAEAPDADTWNHYVDALTALIEQVTTPIHIFAVTDGGGPDAPQRRALAQAFARDRRGALTHVFTTSSFTRGIVTAFHWVARARAVAHHPDEFRAVCAACDVPLHAVIGDLWVLQQELPPVALLAQIARGP